MNQTESFRTVNRRVMTASLIINLIGAVAAGSYLTYIDPLPSEMPAVEEVEPIRAIVFNSLLIGVFVVAVIISIWSGRRIGRWYERIQGGMPAESAPDPVRRAVLNASVRAAVLTAGMWLLAGTMAGLQESSLRIFVGMSLVGGIVATAITFFAHDLLWRPVIPVFFPDGRLSSVDAFHLPVLGRLLIAFFFIGVYPLAILAMLTWGRAQALLTAPDPEAVLNNLLAMEIYLLIAGVMASIGLALFVTRAITGPLNDLQSAMKRVEEDDLVAQVQVVTGDEFGYLGEQFNKMVAGLRQARKLRNLLDLYISPEVAREALQSGAGLGGSQTECSVLFSDIRDFTSISERLAPEQLIALLNRYMMTMINIIVKNQGIVNKFGGDSLLAIFGTPLNPAQDHAARAVYAAQGMQQALREFNQAQRTGQGPALETGIGIATG
ncbi:MAG: adenylate/guanylate cyclase domain-containing protein, partial [Chloroflexota bacterium]